MDIAELRDAFTASEQIGERLKLFREDRVRRIEGNDTPTPIAGGAKLVVHVLPLHARFGETTGDLRRFVAENEALLNPIRGNPRAGRYNIDGYLTYRQPRDDSPPTSYVQMFRDGILEAVDASTLLPAGCPEGQRRLRMAASERMLIECVPRYVEAQRCFGIAPPWR